MMKTWIAMMMFIGYHGAIARLTDTGIDEGPVCGNDHVTYASYQALLQANSTTVMHCGNCGECSTAHDIQIYKDTRNTLTKTTRTCAIQSMFLGKKRAQRCMSEKVGLTDACNACWVENIECTKEKCRCTCLMYYILGKGEFVGKLDPCLACDESECGPAFAKCAGANRRRAGIKSDIARPDEQICSLVHCR